MNRRPRAPLEAEERALAALLPRLHGRAEPGADLDARILAASREALLPRPAPRRRRHWMAPTALAASLMLALGLAWQLRPPPAARAPASTEAMDAPVADTEQALRSPAMVTAPAPAEEVGNTAQPAPEGRVLPAEPPPPARRAPVASAPPPPAEVMVAPAPPAAVMVAPPPPPPAPVAEQRPLAFPAPDPAPQVAGSARAAPAAAKSAGTAAGAAVLARERVLGATAPAPARNEAAQAADAATLDSIVVTDDPEEDVPPATLDSPEVRDAWLRRIGELLKQGRAAEARASLEEFRRRHPDASIPPELRKLEP